MRRSGPVVGSAVQAFSLLAVLTSFVGTTLSTSETLRSEVPPLLDAAAARLHLRRQLAAEAQAGLSDGRGGGGGGGGLPLPLLPAAAATDLNSAATRALVLGLTLGPPLVFTIYNPDSFLGVLQVRPGLPSFPPAVCEPHQELPRV